MLRFVCASCEVLLRFFLLFYFYFYFFYSLFFIFRLFCASCEVLLSFGALGEHVGHDYDLLTQVWTYAEVCWRVLTYADVS